MINPELKSSLFYSNIGMSKYNDIPVLLVGVRVCGKKNN